MKRMDATRKKEKFNLHFKPTIKKLLIDVADYHGRSPSAQVAFWAVREARRLKLEAA